MADVMGEQDLRAQHWDPIVTGFALQEYRLKQVVTIVSSSAWLESYYQETSAELAGHAQGSTVKGIPRGAAFPHGEPSWTLATARHNKYGLQGTIFWEDMATSNFDVVARTLLRIGRGVASAVDNEIYDGLSSGTGNTVAAAATWDATVIANRDPIQDILNAIKLCAEDNYDMVSGSGWLLVSPKDFANLLGNANVRNAGQFYTADVTKNGKVGRLLGLNVVVTNSVNADEAMVIIGKEAATWKEAQPLKVVSIEDPGVKWTIRAFEVGVLQVTNPNAICTITNTQA